ncbi:MAG: T9SS type A sorting domain-containing protein [bacterium]|nr:T9SS type A sorting domain-containing protein [bacterium]
MKKLLTSLVLFFPLSVFADNLVFNGGFDTTPWDSGWVEDTVWAGGEDHDLKITSSSTIYHSPSQSCSLYAYAYYKPMNAANVQIRVFQSIPPVVSCTCQAYFQYNIPFGQNGTSARAGIIITKNDSLTYYWLSPSAVWEKWEQVYSSSDTVTCISFNTEAAPEMAGGTGETILLIDDVYISGTKVGVEDKSNIKTPSTRLRASPNPFVQKTVVSGSASGGSEESKIQIYDVAGKLVKETKDNTITATAGCSIGEDLKAGIYFIKLNTDKNNTFVKLIKLK